MTLEYASTTTLAAIRAASPCKDGWEMLLAHLGKTKADDEPLPLLTVLESNGFDDALWVLSFAMPDDRLARHFQAWCAEQVLHHFERKRPDDMRVRAQIEMLRNDMAARHERDAARAAASAAASDAMSSIAASADAWDVSKAASNAAASCSAARAAASADALGASRAATRSAVWDAVTSTASHTARDAQEKQLRRMIEQEKAP